MPRVCPGLLIFSAICPGFPGFARFIQVCPDLPSFVESARGRRGLLDPASWPHDRQEWRRGGGGRVPPPGGPARAPRQCTRRTNPTLHSPLCHSAASSEGGPRQGHLPSLHYTLKDLIVTTRSRHRTLGRHRGTGAVKAFTSISNYHFMSFYSMQ